MKLSVKLTLVFLLLSLVPLALVGYMAYQSGRQVIQENTQSRLVANNIFKKNELNRWLDGTGIQLRQFARRPLIREFVQTLTNPDATEAEMQAARNSLLSEHLQPTVEEEVGFLELALLDSRNGKILVSTDPDQEGKFRESETYFVEGRQRTYVDNVRYSLSQDQAVMNTSTPIKDEGGRVVAVLTGHLDLSIMTEIMNEASGFTSSQETYLVNAFNFFVTNPKLGGNVALKKAIHTAGVQTCLANNTGVGLYNDYREVPVMGAYQWLPEREMCILTEVDQAEAFAPIQRLGNIMIGVGGLIAGLVAILAVVFARTMIRPIQELVKGTQAIGQGNLDYRINISRRDELGELASAFNQMANQRNQTEQELREQQIFLQNIYQSVELAIFVVDVPEEGDFYLVGLNPTHERLTGFKSVEVAGKTLDEALTPFIPSEAVATIRANYVRCVEAGRPIEYEEMIPIGGRDTWWLTKLSPIRNAEQRIYRIIGSSTHITKRKQMEDELRRAHDELELRVKERTAALRQSEERYRTLAEAAPDMIYVINRDDKVEYVNTLAARQFGGKPADIIGKSRSRLFPSPVNQHQKLALEAVMATGQPLSGEDKIKFPGGEVWLNTHLVPLKDEAGEVAAVMGVSRNVTERKQAEAKLKASEERFRALIQNSSDVIVLIDAQGKILYESQAVTRVLGFSPKERVGQNAFETIHPNDMKQATQLFEQLFQKPDKTLSLELRVRNKAGQWRWVEAVGSNLLDDPAVQAIVANYRDITGRKQAELALQENERNLRRAQRIAHLGSWEMEIATGKSEWSDEFFRICGFEPGAIEPTAERGFELVHPDDRETAAKAVENMLEQSQNYAIEKRIIRPTGEVRHVLSQGELVYDDNGQPVKLTRTFLDITERKQIELALSKKAEELARSNKELEQFAYVASHDLQEPLRMVTSYLQLLARRYSNKLDDDAHEFIAYAVDGAKRMKILINDLLAFSRVDTQGKEKLPTNCEAVLKQALDNLELTITEQQAIVTHDPLPTVLADANQLELLLQNLISNGLKFHADTPPRIHVGVEQQNDYWQFSVQDNGIGFEPEFAEKIFVIFQRLHNKEEYPGTGIGLAICKKIVERHNGRIWVESELGQGSTFYFTLPDNTL